MRSRSRYREVPPWVIPHGFSLGFSSSSYAAPSNATLSSKRKVHCCLTLSLALFVIEQERNLFAQPMRTALLPRPIVGHVARQAALSRRQWIKMRSLNHFTAHYGCGCEHPSPTDEADAHKEQNFDMT